MAKLTTAEFIDAIKELTVLELNDLVKAARKFGHGTLYFINSTIFCDTPRECCSESGNFLTLQAFGLHPQADIFESVFAFVLSRKCGNFKTEGRRTALISCVDYGQGVFCTHRDIPYLSKCGVSRRLFQSRSYHNLLLDKRNSAPHFLFVHNPLSRNGQ